MVVGPKHKKNKRKLKVRAKLKKVSQRPRLTVFRSGKHIYAQIIDDFKRITLVSACDQQLKTKEGKSSNLEVAKQVGELLASKAKAKKITAVAAGRAEDQGYV